MSRAFFLLGGLAGSVLAYHCPLRISSVEGASMQPSLNPDWQKEKQKQDYVLVQRISQPDPDQLLGRVVVLRNPKDLRDLLTKRVTAKPQDQVWRRPTFKVDHPPILTEIPKDHVWVSSDAGQGFRDSDHFGPVSKDHVLGRVVLIVWPPHRIGRVD